jgi:vacuolar protein sorting-associated protein 13A/C
MRNSNDERYSDNSAQSQGMWASLTAKIINNIQVTVKNIHIRYEDKMSVPGVRDIKCLLS